MFHTLNTKRLSRNFWSEVLRFLAVERERESVHLLLREIHLVLMLSHKMMMLSRLANSCQWNTLILYISLNLFSNAHCTVALEHSSIVCARLWAIVQRHLVFHGYFSHTHVYLAFKHLCMFSSKTYWLKISKPIQQRITNARMHKIYIKWVCACACVLCIDCRLAPYHSKIIINATNNRTHNGRIQRIITNPK